MTTLIFIAIIDLFTGKVLISLPCNWCRKKDGSQNNQIVKTFMSLISRILRKVALPVYYTEKVLLAKGILSSQNLVLPDFLCIGVQKAGTSWLYENLRLQPEIFMPDKKELDYFSNSYQLYSYPLSYYSSYFDQAQKKLKGEATPYSDLPIERIQLIHKIMPQVKLIIILRNPVDRIWSAGLMHLVRARQQKFEEILESEFQHFLEKEEILKQGFYTDLLKNWRVYFPDSQLHISFYDDLMNDPKLFLQNVLHFLGIDNTKVFIPERVNESPKHPMPKRLRSHFLELYRPSIIELSKEFGEKALVWLRPANP
jgi:hypothetical protein